MYIFGASGHGKVIASLVIAMKKTVLGFIDDHPKGVQLMGLPVKHSNDVQNLSSDEVIIGVGNNTMRKNIAQRLTTNFLTLIHTSAVICKTVNIEEGTIVFPNAVINVDTKIGSHVIINTGAIVEHDCMVGNFAHISPNATIAGGVTVGEGTHIGIGACVIPGVTIGKWATIGAGTVIINDVPDGAVVVGNPGKVIKTSSRT